MRTKNKQNAVNGSPGMECPAWAAPTELVGIMAATLLQTGRLYEAILCPAWAAPHGMPRRGQTVCKNPNPNQ
ncbi:hypothetical protein [Arundinibacter roseus]|uniref:Uncharacterized protein n=1 Tax=Arundinibacter roseus TaxID=2070510 RepID=A0A4R4K9R5_9BACT|nr:hypothetical protein [Arundinibacter roseus]TDB63382.1 hypothetical protein EZE20_16575 [Arundinibacter roseus]